MDKFFKYKKIFFFTGKQIFKSREIFLTVTQKNVLTREEKFLNHVGNFSNIPKEIFRKFFNPPKTVETKI